MNSLYLSTEARHAMDQALKLMEMDEKQDLAGALQSVMAGYDYLVPLVSLTSGRYKAEQK